MGIKSKIKRSSPTTLICLQETAPVSSDDLLYEMYQDEKESPAFEKAQVSVINSILHQRRAYFAMTRKLFFELLKNDSNWSNKIKAGSRVYSGTIRLLCEHPAIIECVYQGTGRQVSIYQLVDQELLAHLNFSPEEIEAQRVEARKWVRKEHQNGSASGPRSPKDDGSR